MILQTINSFVNFLRVVATGNFLYTYENHGKRQQGQKSDKPRTIEIDRFIRE